MAKIIGSERWIRFDTTAETVPGVVNAAPTYKAFRMVGGGGSGVTAGKVVVPTTESANVLTQPAPELSHFESGFDVPFIPSPQDATVTFGAGSDGILRFLLDLFFTRTSGLLASHTFELVDAPSGPGTPAGILTQQFPGCKINTLTFSTAGGFLTTSIGMMSTTYGRRETPITNVGLVFPTSRNWLMRNIGSMIDGDLTSVVTDDSFRDMTITLSNNLTRGTPRTWRPKDSGNGDAHETDRHGTADLIEGPRTAEGSFTFDLEDAVMFDRFLEDDATDKRVAVRVLGAHPDSARTTLTGSETSDGVDDIFGVASETGFAAGDVAILEDSAADDPETWVREVLEVSATGVGSLTFTTDGTDDNGESNGRSQTFAGTTTHVFSKALQFRIPQAQILDFQPVGSEADRVGRTVTWQGEVASGETQVFGYLLH